MSDRVRNHRAVILGGGLAGLAAAERLTAHGIAVRLYEGSRRLGGRAGSFRDPETEENFDHCQHVAMGCCTHYLALCHSLGCHELLDRGDRIPFLFRPGKVDSLQAAAWLPAPVHLAPFLLRLSYLSWGERLSVATTLLRLARLSLEPRDPRSIGEWLRSQRQTDNAVDRFWSVVLVSALGENLERASLAAAQKVFVDGFMSNAAGYSLRIPNTSLQELYERMATALEARGASIATSHRVIGLGLREAERKREQGKPPRVDRVELEGETITDFDVVICAVDWRAARRIADGTANDCFPEIPFSEDDSAPITSIHLWLDRPIHSLPYAVLVDRTSQWIFQRPQNDLERKRDEHYYQVVVSASRDLRNRPQAEVIEMVLLELAEFWPNTKNATVKRSRMITQRDAVFSYRPGVDAMRPDQTTSASNLFLAGDWTNTGWPATMEGAVRSGNLAADAALRHLGLNISSLPDDLPVNALARHILRTRR